MNDDREGGREGLMLGGREVGAGIWGRGGRRDICREV